MAEAANYLITIDTEAGVLKVEKAAYQATEVNYGVIYAVGGACPNGWSVDDATPLRQNLSNPVEYAANIELKAAPESFKLTTNNNGGFDNQWFFFRDADDAAKISTDATDDRQWSVEEAGLKGVTVNTVANTIVIGAQISAAIQVVDDANLPVEYYNLQGVRVAQPESGLYIRVQGKKAVKIAF